MARSRLSLAFPKSLFRLIIRRRRLNPKLNASFYRYEYLLRWFFYPTLGLGYLSIVNVGNFSIIKFLNLEVMAKQRICRFLLERTVFDIL